MTSHDAPDLPRRRCWLVYSILSVILGGHLVSIAADRDVWPFSCYAMYSYRATPAWSETMMYGVPVGDDREFPLNEDHLVLSRIVLRTYLQRAQRRGGEQALQQAAGHALQWYEARRAAGRHEGPPLRAIRAYELHWAYQPDAANRAEPDRRELLVEARRS